MARRRRRNPRRRCRRNPIKTSTLVLLGAAGVGAYLLLRKKDPFAGAKASGSASAAGFGTIDIPSGMWAPAVPTTAAVPSGGSSRGLVVTPAALSALQQVAAKSIAPLSLSKMSTPFEFKQASFQPPGVQPEDYVGQAIQPCPVVNGLPTGPLTVADLQALCQAQGGSWTGTSCVKDGVTYSLDAGGCLKSGGGAGGLGTVLPIAAAAAAALFLLK